MCDLYNRKKYERKCVQKDIIGVSKEKKSFPKNCKISTNVNIP